MKQRRLIITPSAEADLRDIYTYTLQQWGTKQAENYLNLLRERYLILQTASHFSSPITVLDVEIYGLKCAHHYAYFLIGSDSLVIIAFLHERMNMLRHLTQRLPVTPH